MRSIEALVLERIEGVFARCPELFRLSVRDRTGLSDPVACNDEIHVFQALTGG